MNHLGQAPLFSFCGCPPVDSVKGQDRQMVERGGRKRAEPASTLPGLMQQGGAEAGSQYRFPHPAARSCLLQNIAPLMTWCHVVILFGIRDSRVQK